MDPAITSAASRPNIAIVLNAITPYRVALHRRVAREIPEVCLWTLYTHGGSDQPWTSPPAPEINPVEFGEHDAVEQESSPKRALHEYLKAGKIIRWLVQHNVRAVFLSGYSDLGRLRLFHWCSRNRLPIFLLADSNIYGDSARGLKKIVKSIVVGDVVRQCVAVMPFGTAGAKYFHRYGADPSKIIFFPQEPDYNAIEEIAESEIQLAAEHYGLQSGRRRFVYCGRLQPVKRPDLAVRAFLRTAVRIPDWDLVLIGDGPMMKTCTELVPVDMKHRIIFTGFVANQRSIAAIYRLSDALVIPSDSEAWGLVVNEATCAGLAVIASEVVGSVPELVHPAINGLVFTRGDEEQLSAAMMSIAENPPLLQSMKHASVQILREWRRIGDPIRGMRTALERAGIFAEASLGEA